MGGICFATGISHRIDIGYHDLETNIVQKRSAPVHAKSARYIDETPLA